MPNIDHCILVAYLNLRISVYLESGAPSEADLCEIALAFPLLITSLDWKWNRVRSLWHFHHLYFFGLGVEWGAIAFLTI
ncbi:MAG: hypothetical protein SAK29_27695 [Scytonema sp. PMC 1069.18]|nr:hypothetical protein [Scytonema sp. PMC 1069.18]MEC4882030.1 hypothetical protein [Scytonema sp. PMC 1070.18]